MPMLAAGGRVIDQVGLEQQQVEGELPGDRLPLDAVANVGANVCGLASPSSRSWTA